MRPLERNRFTRNCPEFCLAQEVANVQEEAKRYVAHLKALNCSKDQLRILLREVIDVLMDEL